MKSSYGAVLTDLFFAWGRFNRKWGRFGLGPFSTGAVLTDNRLLALANMGTVHQLLEKKCSKIIRLPDTCKPIFYARLAIYVAEQGHNSL